MIKARTYRARGIVTICLELTAEFTDDGKFDLEDQAFDALHEHDDIPLSMMSNIDSIDIEEIEEVKNA